MIRVVQPDGDELADTDVRHTEARRAGHERQRFRFYLRQLLQFARCEVQAVDLVNDARQITNPA